MACSVPAGLLALLILVSSFTLSLSSAVLRFNSPFDSDSSSPAAPPPALNYTILLYDRPWLASAPISFRALNRTFTDADGSLVPVSSTEFDGVDSFGAFHAHTFLWSANPSLTKAALQWETTFRVYDLPALQSGAVVFQQRWVTGATGTSTGDMNGVLSAFPSFHMGADGIEEQGYLQWAGQFAWDDTKVGYWAGNGSTAQLETMGVRSGPIVPVRQEGAAGVDAVSRVVLHVEQCGAGRADSAGGSAGEYGGGAGGLVAGDGAVLRAGRSEFVRGAVGRPHAQQVRQGAHGRVRRDDRTVPRLQH